MNKKILILITAISVVVILGGFTAYFFASESVEQYNSYNEVEIVHTPVSPVTVTLPVGLSDID